MSNSIAEIKDSNEEMVFGFEKTAQAGNTFFSNLFKEPLGCPTVEILKVISLFPSHITLELNDELKCEIIENEFFQTLSSFQRCKSPGPDGLMVEFYLGFNEFLKGDLFKVVNESKWFGKVASPLNSTHIALIPKTYAPSSFEKFRPISCGDLIYKLIDKILANRLKLIFSSFISEEQSGFLFNHQIHDVVSLTQEALHSIKKKNSPPSF
jgi:hypothetical protein